MPASGVIVVEGDRLPSSQRTPGSVDTAIFVGEATRGPADRLIEINGAAELDAAIGAPFGGSHLRRAVDAFFADGGLRALVRRAVDATAVTAKAAVPGAGGTVLNLEADGPGTWGNLLTLTVADGVSGRKLLTLKENGATKASVEASSTAEAIGRLSKATPIKVTAGATAWPPTNAASITFTGGVAADSAVTDANILSALATVSYKVGPATLAVPGRTSATVHDALFRHGQANGFHVLADLPDIPEAASLITQAAGTRLLDNEKAGRAGQLLWPWEVVSVGPYLDIPVPPSGGLAGRMARVDRDSPRRQARAAAGPQYASRNAIDVTRTPTDADADLLADAGITLIRKEPEGVCAMGAKNVVDGQRWPQYLFAAGHRTRMAIVDQARAVVRPFLFDALDGEGVRLETIKGVVENVCKPYSEEPQGGLYDENGDRGYSVSIGSTQTELAQGLVRIVLALRTSPSIDMVVIEFTAVALGDTL